MISIRGAGHPRPLHGIFLPVATPFDHNGDLYHAKLKHNVEKWNQTGLSGYVVCATTGESVALSSEEKVTLWGWVAEYAAPEKLLIAGVGAEGIRETVLLANRAAAIGYTAALVTTPYSYQDRPTQELYFRTVADQAKIPVIVCGQPDEAVIRLAQHPNIIAVVEESEDTEKIVKLKPSLDVLAGSEAALWSSLSAGAVGAVLAYANAAPYSAITIWEAHRGRHAETGLDWQERITRPALLVTSEYGIPGLKHAMDLNGYYGGPCRLPLVPPTLEAKREIEAAFRDLRG